MGYTTEFDGTFKLNDQLTQDLYNRLMEFADARHCKEDNYNEVEEGMPDFYCQWIPTLENGGGIEWDGGEKFYGYKEWLQYIIDHFLTPNGYRITEDSKVNYRGEDFNDHGYLSVKDGKVIDNKHKWADKVS